MARWTISEWCFGEFELLNVVVGEDDVAIETKVVCIRKGYLHGRRKKLKMMMSCFKVSTSTPQPPLRALYL